MKAILLLPLFFLTLPLQAARICYFSLNNVKEFKEMETFTKKLNKHSKIKIEVQEFVTKGDNAEDAFQKMVDSGVECDGLVISGHHTGSFGGANASSSLSIDFMEKLSCDPKNKKFFEKIKALWLQGCRTLGVGKIETYDTADFHTTRVGAVLEEDHLTQSFADLNMEFSATLDQDNPLSSRYLRVFPRATTFGWTKTAPGEKARSELSVPFHIAHIAHLNDDRKRYFEDPMQEDLSEETALKYSVAILDVLGKAQNQKQECEIQRDEEKLVNAWKEHGTPGDGNQYFFTNPDLNAYVSMLKSGSDQIKKAKELDCLLKTTKDPKVLLSVLDEVLKEDSLIGYNFNSIYEIIQRLMKSGEVESLVKVRQKLRDSSEMNQFLMKKLASNELGLLRRIDYYAFWKSMTNSSNGMIEKKIRDVYVEMMLKASRDDDYQARDFKDTLTQSLSKHGLVRGPELRLILKSPIADKYAITNVAYVIGNSNVPIEGASEMLKEIVKSPKADGYIYYDVAIAIGNSKVPIESASEMLKEIVKSPKAHGGALGSVAIAIGKSKAPIDGASEILKEIVKSPNADWRALGDVAYAIGNSEVLIEGASEMLKEIVKSPKANGSALGSVANVIGNLKVPIEGASKILKEIVKSPKADWSALGSVANVIGNLKVPIEGTSEILKEIVKSPKADRSALFYTANAIGNSKTPIEGASEILKEIVKSPKTHNNTLNVVADVIKNSKAPIKDADEILKLIEQKTK